MGPLLAAQVPAPCGGREAADMGCCGGKRRSRGGVGRSKRGGGLVVDERRPP